MKCILIDTDVDGWASVADLSHAGLVEAYSCRSLADVEGVYWGIKREQIKGDYVVVDTVTNMGSRTIADVVRPAGAGLGQSITANLAALVPSRNEYGQAGHGALHILRPIFELPIPVIFVCHERVREDPMSGIDKVGPDVQGMILSNIICWAGAIVRLTTTPIPYQLPNGETMPAGTRMLQLAPTGEAACGVRTHVVPPPAIYDPTLADFIAAIGGRLPKLTILFGRPKLGKTTLAAGADRRQRAA